MIFLFVIVWGFFFSFFGFNFVCLFLFKTVLLIDILGSTEKMSEEMLNNYFDLLYTVLEPRDIANVMLQAGQISVHDHDDITNNRKKYKRLRILLYVLNKKQLYTSFACLLESLQYTSLLETLTTDAPYINIVCK